MRKRSVVAILGAGALVLASCTPSIGPLRSLSGSQKQKSVSASHPAPAPLANAGDQAPAGFADYYTQTVNLIPCEPEQVSMGRMDVPADLQNYQCGTAKAPLDWDDPSSPEIELALAVYSKGGSAEQGALFFNLGGPGGDAVRSLSSVVEYIVPPALTGAFDLVALDPRGVGQSTPISCWDDAEKDELLAEPDDDRNLPLEEFIAAAEAEVEEVYAKCAAGSGEILNYADTDSAAHDLDMVRAVLGEEELDYLGYSYGTMLGAVYADLFPSRVGRLVLDGALDPARNSNEISELQAGGMENALYHWIETCQEDKKCPVKGDLESGKRQMIDFFESLRAAPLDTGDPNRPLTESLARTGVIGSLYSPESYPFLTTGMEMAVQGDGSILLLLADFYNGREDDGTFDNSQDAFVAINFLDYEPVGTPQEWQQQAERIAAEYPVLGTEFGYSSAGLNKWAAESRYTRAPLQVRGTNPILVIGTTHDPATPYVMAETLTDSIEGAVLVTVDGWGHGAYQQGASTCLTDVVENYLLYGEVPPPGIVCEE